MITRAWMAGTERSKNKRKNWTMQTVSHCLPVLRTRYVWRWIPGTVPNTVTPHNSKQYGPFTIPKIAITIAADNVTNNVKYIPVAEPTSGCNPSDISTGLKINPVPVPQQAPKKLPKNAIMSSFDAFRQSH
jgi:hypothetical protein